jgi:hypothetical protein
VWKHFVTHGYVIGQNHIPIGYIEYGFGCVVPIPVGNLYPPIYIHRQCLTRGPSSKHSTSQLLKLSSGQVLKRASPPQAVSPSSQAVRQWKKCVRLAGRRKLQTLASWFLGSPKTPSGQAPTRRRRWFSNLQSPVPTHDGSRSG